MTKLLTILGAGLLVAGAVVLIGPTFGFSMADVDRGVSVDTTATEDALLAINGTDESPTQQEDAAVVEITNNAGVDFDTLDTTIAIDDDSDAVEISGPFDDSLAAGERTSLELTCSGGGEGTATISVDTDATGSGLSVSGVSYEHTVFYRCTGQSDPGGGFQSVSAEDVSGSGTVTQTVSFTPDGNVGNGERVRITLTSDTSGVFLDGLDYRDAEPRIVEPRNSNDNIEVIERTDSSITFDVIAQGQLGDGRTFVIDIGGVSIQDGAWFDFGFGSVEFTRLDSGETATETFLITETDQSTATMTTTTSYDGPSEERTTVTRDELEEVDIDELDSFDSLDELIAEIETHDDIELID